MKSEKDLRSLRNKYVRGSHADKVTLEGAFGIRQVALALGIRHADYENLLTQYGFTEANLAALLRELRDDQKSADTCWAHATRKQLKREAELAGVDVEGIHFSADYMNYYNLKRKGHVWLDKAIDAKDPLNIDWNETGNFDHMMQMIGEVGLVDESAMPKTLDIVQTSALKALIHQVQARAGTDASRLRTKLKDAPPGELERALNGLRKSYGDVIDDMIARAYGGKENIPGPNDSFKAKGGTYTPMTYAAKYVPFGRDAFVQLSNIPTKQLGWGRGYVAKEGDGWRDNIVYNAPFATVKKAIEKAVRENHLVYFSMYMPDFGYEDPQGLSGPDPGLQDVLPAGVQGLKSDPVFDSGYKKLFPGFKPASKRALIESGIEPINVHDMVIVALRKDGKGVLVANSWGKNHKWDGLQEYSWEAFRKHTGHYVLPTSAVPERTLEAYKKKPLGEFPLDARYDN